MDDVLFQRSFPAFPTDSFMLQKLGVMLREKKAISNEEWDTFRKEKTDPEELIFAVATRQQVTPRMLAEIEATILDMAFVDLDAVQIPSEVLKLFTLELMVEHKAIPIKLNGQELLVGMLAPAKSSEIFQALGAKNPTLALKPAKVLWDALEKRLKQLSEQKKPAAPAGGKKGPRKRLGDIIVEAKYCTAEQMKDALDKAKKDKTRLGAYLVKNGILSNKQLSIALSKQFDIPYIDLEESLVDPVLATLLPKKLCYDHILCPVKKEESKLVIAMTDPTDIITIDHIEMMTGMRISPVVSSELSIMSALGKLYGESVDALADQVGGGDGSSADEALGDLGENDAPIIKLVNLIITQAVQTGASDIHIEPFEDELRVRFRKDGVMKLQMKPTKAAHAGVVSRIKVMANLDIAETRCPQDGRIKLHLSERKVDLRVSLVPCVWGEKVCMRLLDQGNLKVNLTDLGFEPHVLELFMDGVKAPNGIVLVTGPTGSGKTTTLYSSLFLLNNPAINIMTAEDPVEYNLMGINQVQCHADIGLDFGAALRSFLRQDPNVIMIGEIRDFETASIAIKAAMTGHLVISTLHTNDAPSTISRLLNMGIEPFSLTTSIRVVEAQRLVRKICKSCAAEFKPAPDVVKSLGITPQLLQKLRLTELDIDNLSFSKGTGCQDCDNSGYKGRQGIYEVLSMTGKIREMIENKASTEELRRQALADGMLSLRESAIYKLLNKRTTVEEIFRTTLDAGGDDQSTAKPNAKKVAVSVPASQPAAATAASGAVPADMGVLTSFTGELQAFRASLDKLSAPAGGHVAIGAEALKSNLADPLAQIQTLAQAGDPAKALPIIQAQGQKMDFNIRNMMYHFGAAAASKAPLPLNELVDTEIIGKLRHHVVTARLLSGRTDIGQGLKVAKNLAKDLPDISFDIEYFRHVVSNVVVNSLMALKPNGELKFMSRLKPGTTDRVELVIFDNGAGISVEDQARLFTPFSPLGRKTLGLGLAVSRKLMNACGGQILVKSTPGANTLVTIEFPAAS
ncbi:Flp pilus assembly complex ATPase component TadA [Candidatus Ozemobacteraceae bacterium]|nr:Flp pilus assembly complex ATPase component TadA [Candidatus Ozemobacteraceae bacterium]